MFKVHHNNEVLVSHLEIEVKKTETENLCFTIMSIGSSEVSISHRLLADKLQKMKTTKPNITKLQPKNVQQACKRMEK